MIDTRLVREYQATERFTRTDMLRLVANVPPGYEIDRVEMSVKTAQGLLIFTHATEGTPLPDLTQDYRFVVPGFEQVRFVTSLTSQDRVIFREKQLGFEPVLPLKMTKGDFLGFDRDDHKEVLLDTISENCPPAEDKVEQLLLMIRNALLNRETYQVTRTKPNDTRQCSYVASGVTILITAGPLGCSWNIRQNIATIPGRHPTAADYKDTPEITPEQMADIEKNPDDWFVEYAQGWTPDEGAVGVWVFCHRNEDGLSTLEKCKTDGSKVPQAIVDRINASIMDMDKKHRAVTGLSEHGEPNTAPSTGP